MPRSLQGVLASIPGLGGYAAADEESRNVQMGQLQQMGALQGILARSQAQQKEAGLRQALGSLGPDATEEQTLKAIIPFASPDKILAVKEGAAARKAATQQRAMEFIQTTQLRQDDLDRKREEFMQKSTDNNAKMAFEQWYKTESMRNQANQNAILNSLKQQGIELQKQGLDLRKGEMERKVTEEGAKKTTQLQSALEKANLPEADAVLKAVEDVLATNKDLAGYISGPKSVLPDLVVPKDIAVGRQAFQKLFNITLKDRSGAAVTIPEFERLKKEFATGIWRQPGQLEAGVEQARNIIKKHYQSVAAGFGPEALKNYNENMRGLGGRVVLESPSSASPVDALLEKYK